MNEIPGGVERRAMSVSVGSIVNYVLPDDSKNPREIRPAIIVQVWSDTCVNLQVFCDGSNDYPYADGTLWVTSALYSDEKQPRSWHFQIPA